MSKKSEYSEVVLPLLKEKNAPELKAYILAKANLPGRMGNITLVHTIASLIAKDKHLAAAWYPVFKEWWQLEANGNDAETVVLLSALESFGSLYKNSSEKERLEIEEILAEALGDPRWRVREVVTESYKWIAKVDDDIFINLFNKILEENLTPLTMRGILATVAHPEILASDQQREFAQNIMEMAFDYYSTNVSDFSKEEKDILKKGLAFAPSVIVSKHPATGFAFFTQLIESQDKDINRIVGENLKKKRLASVYPLEVEDLLAKIENQK